MKIYNCIECNREILSIQHEYNDNLCNECYDNYMIREIDFIISLRNQYKYCLERFLFGYEK